MPIMFAPFFFFGRWIVLQDFWRGICKGHQRGNQQGCQTSRRAWYRCPGPWRARGELFLSVHVKYQCSFVTRCLNALGLNVIFLHRGTTWSSTLESNCRALPSQSMGGCNLMVPAVSSHPSFMVMSVVPRPWQSSGPQWLRAWPHAQWRECWRVLSPSSTGHLSGMINPGENSLLTVTTL